METLSAFIDSSIDSSASDQCRLHHTSWIHKHS